MGLYIEHLDTVTIRGERSLYVYLLDYGWPEGHWEQLFKRHFMRMASLASEAGAVVIGSSRGVHFGNEVLSWHQVGSLDAERVLPGLLITKTHPDYFQQGPSGEPDMETLLVIPLRDFCTDDATFVRSIERVFVDLKNGLELRDFAIAKHDPRSQPPVIASRIADAIELKPGAFGLNVDLKKLLFRKAS
jgi:hypothetical protein